MLQTRNGKRTAEAALKIAVDMAAEQPITREQAIARIDPASLDQLLHPTLDPKARSPSGTRSPARTKQRRIALSADQAEAQLPAVSRILVGWCSAEDIHGMHAAGILTARGGMTSHAAVVARGMGRACVSGQAMCVLIWPLALSILATPSLKMAI